MAVFTFKSEWVEAWASLDEVTRCRCYDAVVQFFLTGSVPSDGLIRALTYSAIEELRGAREAAVALSDKRRAAVMRRWAKSDENGVEAGIVNDCVSDDEIQNDTNDTIVYFVSKEVENAENQEDTQFYERKRKKKEKEKGSFPPAPPYLLKEKEINKEKESSPPLKKEKNKKEKKFSVLEKAWFGRFARSEGRRIAARLELPSGVMAEWLDEIALDWGECQKRHRSFYDLRKHARAALEIKAAVYRRELERTRKVFANGLQTISQNESQNESKIKTQNESKSNGTDNEKRPSRATGAEQRIECSASFSADF